MYKLLMLSVYPVFYLYYVDLVRISNFYLMSKIALRSGCFLRYQLKRVGVGPLILAGEDLTVSCIL